MNALKYRALIDSALGATRFYKLTMLGMLAITFAMLVLTISMANSERTIIVPPTIEKSFWVERDNVSREYLEQMGLFIAQLELTVSPVSHKYQSEMLLRHVHPSVYGQLQSSLGAAGEALRRDNVSTWFAPRSTLVDAKNKRMSIAGELTTYVGDKVAGKETKNYLIEFIYADSKLYLKTFTETNANDQFTDTPDPKNAAAGGAASS